MTKETAPICPICETEGIPITLESLELALEYMSELECEWRRVKDEVRCGYKARYDLLCSEIKKMQAVIAQVESARRTETD